MMCVPCVGGVSGEFTRGRRQRPRAGTQSEIGPAGSCERHEPDRYQRTQQERRHQQPRQPPSGTPLGECPGHVLSLLPGRSVDIGQRTLRLVISVVRSLQIARKSWLPAGAPPRSGGAPVARGVARVIAVNEWRCQRSAADGRRSRECSSRRSCRSDYVPRPTRAAHRTRAIRSDSARPRS